VPYERRSCPREEVAQRQEVPHHPEGSPGVESKNLELAWTIMVRPSLCLRVCDNECCAREDAGGRVRRS
jgi:hypothetical protein